MADQRFKVEKGLFVGGANNIFTDQVTVGGNTTIEGDLLLVQGNFIVEGDTTYTGSIFYDTDIIPLSPTGRLLGNTTNRFDLFSRNISVNGNLHPTASGLLLGNTTARWDT